jgi:hypothetical protein
MWYDAKLGQGYWGIAVADLAGNQRHEITGRPSKSGSRAAGIWEAFDAVCQLDRDR